ncbi:MFS transporter [Acinetobacter larvae]|uniref:MFS transporter n=1 Tax=Acinetobacter larvae TaxID=1789224 RepID=A0A1B2M0D2_9GAMM|nr:MFS transporter [Acinetobacter larvae]
MNIRKISIAVAVVFLATVTGVLLAIWVFRYFNIYIPLENQSVAIDLQQPLQTRVKIHEPLDVDVTGEVDAVIPINEQLNVPLKQSFRPHVFFDNQVPISTQIPVKETLKIDQNMPINTEVQLQILGTQIKVPLKGVIPIKMDVPIDLKIPLQQKVHLKFDTPVETVFRENLQLPLQTTVHSKIPIAGRLQVPVKEAMDATVEVQNTLAVQIQQGQLKIPLKHIALANPQHRPALKPHAVVAQQ